MSVFTLFAESRAARVGMSMAALASALPVSAVADQILDEVIVTATLRRQTLVEVPASVTVLNGQTLQDAGRQHFQDVLTSVPNLHYAGGSSRPRYFQIRGIGEREGYEGAPNPSVGFLIDDMDYSGIGMPATTFDMERVEVLRGPQGLRYGANALAGLIVLRSHAPEDEFGFSTEASLGEYNSESLGAVATGPVESLNSAWRLSVQRFRSDGFRRSTYLGRDDTDRRDELTARGKWRWQPGDDTTVDFTWLHANINNGYDAWSIDNSRRSLADEPGKDSQRSNGGALRLETSAGSLGRLTLIATGVQADSEHSYDADWGNPESWLPYTYDYFDRFQRERRSRSVEVRLTSEDAATLGWTVGAYALDVDERMGSRQAGVYIHPFDPDQSGSANDFLHSRYDALNVAAYAQLEASINDRWGWSFGLRAEQRDADYRDGGIEKGGPRLTAGSQRDTLWGGQATLHFDMNDTTRLFATVSRGYKAGGFNLGAVADARPDFAPEYLLGLDVGLKGEWLDRRLYADVTAFYMKRTDMQVLTGLQWESEGNPSSYVFITDNASGGHNMGVETSVNWRATEQLTVGGSLGLLRTRYSGYAPEGEDLSRRDQAHAPEYQAALHATWRHSQGYMARLDVAAVDDYYFDVPPNDARSEAYGLVHLKAGYEGERWSLYAWGRNLFDEDYAIRGFNFGNEPPDFPTTRYVQLGEPRQFGVTFRWEFR